MKRFIQWGVFCGTMLTLVGGILLSCSQKPIEGELMLAPNPRSLPPLSKNMGPSEKAILEELKAIYFDYNKSEVKPEARQAIAENARWLKAHPEVAVQIEGHCDERGTREFNYKLGEKRAQRAKEILVSLGIEADRIETVSYGALSGQNEKSWKTNRRAVFVLIYPAEKKSSEEGIAKKVGK